MKLNQTTAQFDPCLINQLLDLYNQGQMTLACDLSARISQGSSDDILWNILGAANKELGKTADAGSCHEIEPQLQFSSQEQGKLERIEAYKVALSLKPDYAKAHDNLRNS